MIKVNLSDGYFFEQDGMDLTLKRKCIYEKGKNIGEEYEISIGYYRRLDKLIERYLKELQSNVLSGAEVGDIEEYAEIIDKVNTHAMEVIVKAMKEGGVVK